MTTAITNSSPGASEPRVAGAAPQDQASDRVAELLERFEELAASLARREEPAGLASLRRQAAERFRREGYPSTRLEAWRFTNPAPATRSRTRVPAHRTLDQLTAIERRTLDALFLPGCRNVVVLDGRPVDGFGTEPDSSAARRAVRVRSLSSGWRRDDDGDGGLGRLAAPTSSLVNAFALLNTAFFEDGVLIEAPEHGASPQPIHLLHVVSATGDPDDDGTVPAAYPRVLVRAAAASELTVVETYASLGDQRALVCPVTEIFCDAGAVVRHYRVNREGAGVVHVGSQHLRLERDASVSSLQLSWGGDLVRCDVHALLAGEGGDCVLDGLYVLGGRQHFDTHMRVEHLAPRCDSHELYKGVIDDAAHAVFDGRIYVHRAAQKTDAKQTNRNLLLSDRAVANSNPQLEIFADDVKCTHGSTIGQLEPDALFYLRSRGIDRDAARSLLTYAFASELLGRIGVAALREAAEAVLVRRLAGGAVVEELRPGVTGAGAGA